MRLVIAGASGFVGRSCIDSLSKTSGIQIRALTRNSAYEECSSQDWTAQSQWSSQSLLWRRCDLYSLKQAEAALEGADFAIFLVHSMMPSSRLVQASFSDTDLLLADNFARAARKSALKRIVYLGGMLPSSGEKLSEHLRSRQEVEHALSAYGTEVRVLRAGIILGSGGSSSEMVFKLVEKLPIMICPAWTLKVSSPVFIDDVVETLKSLVFDDVLPALGRRPDTSPFISSEPKKSLVTFEANSGETITYLSLMKETARQMKRSTLFIPFPYVPPAVSAVWVSLISGYSLSLVRPLVKSLAHDLQPEDSSSLPKPPMPVPTNWRDALARSLLSRENRLTRTSAGALSKSRKASNKVTSIQRMPCPTDWPATRIAEEYMKWLPNFFRPFLQVRNENSTVSFFFGIVRKPLLVLRFSSERSSADRVLFYVVGGLLVKSKGYTMGRLEFRKVNNGKEILAAVLDFEPSLPWWFYFSTQAIGHLIVMHGFKMHLRKNCESS